MKKRLSAIGIIMFGSLFSQNIAFDKLYSNSDPVNYFLGHYPVSGSDGLDINWYGGIRLRTTGGQVQLLNNGNLGIGTLNPQQKLTVSGNQGYNQGVPNNGQSSPAILRLQPSSSGYGEVLDFGVNIGPSYGWIQPQDFNSPSTFYNLSLNPNGGNVGIGTTSPQAKLDVVGDLKSNNHTIVEYSPILFLDRSTNNGGYIQGVQTRLSDGSNNWFFGNLHSDTFLITTGDYTGPKQFVINRNGNAALQGKFEAKEVKVTLTPTADFVFEEDYNLPKLEDVEKHIKEKKHLPEIASAKVMEKEGVNVGEFQIKLLQKIEELTLYSIEQNKQIKKLQEENKNLQFQFEKLKKIEKQLEQILSEKK